MFRQWRIWPCGEERKRKRGGVVCGGFSGYDEIDLFFQFLENVGIPHPKSCLEAF
jgi:hypothetical protein